MVETMMLNFKLSKNALDILSPTASIRENIIFPRMLFIINRVSL